MFRFLAVLVVVLLPFAAHAQEAPDALVKRVTDEVLAIMRSDEDSHSGGTRRAAELAEATVLPHFDFVRMTRLAVGRNWRQASDAQKEALTREFRALLVRTYSRSLSVYRDQAIQVTPLALAPAATETTVRTVVIQQGAPPIPIDYSMERGPDGWKVYDVAIDGVSLVISYRDNFDQQVRSGGIDGLLGTLQDRNRPAEPAAN